MVKTMLSSALIAGLVAMALCSAVAADPLVTPSWLAYMNTNYYAWTTWGPGSGPGVSNPIAPDVTTGSGSASAAVLIDPNAAGLLSGPAYQIGTISRYLDLGPTGSIHIDLTTDNSGPSGMAVWVTTVYHEDMTAAPSVELSSGSLVGSRTSLVEDTSLPGLPSQWTLYEALWMLNPDDVGAFQGLDVIADPGAGSNIQQVTIHTGFVPEPSAALAFLTGLIGFAGIVMRRRT
jgi:hypothetical protein